MSFDHSNAICASLGHWIGEVFVVFCPHRQGWEVIIRSGDDKDDTSLVNAQISFGPFDQVEDVEQRLVDEIRQLLSAHRRAWLEASAASSEG